MRIPAAFVAAALLVGAGWFTASGLAQPSSSFNTSPDPTARAVTAQKEAASEQEPESTSTPEPSTSSSQSSDPAMATGSPVGRQEETASPSPADTPEALIANELVQVANKARRSAGLSALELDPLLTEQATWWAGYMPQNGYEHSSSERLSRIMDSGSFDAVGENLHAPEAQCPSQGNCTEARDYPTSRIVVIDWLNSQSHRENLLDERWTAVGIGITCGGDGRMWVAALFAGRDTVEPKHRANATPPSDNSGMTCLGFKRAHNPQWQHP